MGLLSIQARIACDDCGKTFTADLDPAAKCQTPFDAAEAAMTGGEGSHYDGVMRCEPCTDKYVSDWIAEHPNAISGIHPIDGGWRVVTFAEAEHFVPHDHPAGEPKFEADIAPWLAPVDTPSPTGDQVQ